jgi:hypothetical protein
VGQEPAELVGARVVGVGRGVVVEAEDVGLGHADVKVGRGRQGVLDRRDELGEAVDEQLLLIRHGIRVVDHEQKIDLLAAHRGRFVATRHAVSGKSNVELGPAVAVAIAIVAIAITIAIVAVAIPVTLGGDRRAVSPASPKGEKGSGSREQASSVSANKDGESRREQGMGGMVQNDWWARQILAERSWRACA